MAWDGILILDKPLGPSSAGVLNRVKRLLPRGTKIGHAGTLDPLASGVLVALVGRATKSCESIMGLPKQYLAGVRFGYTSATDDAEGPLECRLDPEGVLPATLDFDRAMRDALLPMRGTVEQFPPRISALKVGGRRMSDRTRAGEVVELKPRLVRIDAIDIIESRWPDLTLRIDCGRGFYVRSLARDLGERLGTGAYLASLCRTAVGPFRVENAENPDGLTSERLQAALLNPATLLAGTSIDRPNPV